jgi:DNA ligase (NAD+)
MTKYEAKLRIEKLKKLIDKYRYSRHVLDKEVVPIDVEDSLKKELFDLEQKFPDLITPDSPSQRVGGKPLEKFEKVKHPKPMLSFNDAFSVKDMENWLERILKLLPPKEKQEIDFYCEPKLDGLAIELIYENGLLKTGSTRGDGIFGEDVTQNLKTIESIPLKLNYSNYGKDKIIVVRAEVIITKKNFEKINQKQEKLGLPKFANPRNLAAGSIRQLNPKVAKERQLDSTAYGLVLGIPVATHEQEHKILHELGFKTNNKYSKLCKNLSEVIEFHNFWQKNRDKLPYEIDGLVVTINNNEIFEKLGVVGKAPRGAIAFKFPLKQATTIVEQVLFQVGRSGAVTPIAVLKPVEVGGVVISRATLHNEDEIKKLGLKIGDTVIVGRAGDVIPDIVRVLPEMRQGKEKEIRFPEKCPVCQSQLEKPSGEAVWRCPNPKCFARKREYFYHFVSKPAFDIVGLGPKIINRLLDEGLVSDPADLFKLEEGDILSLERFAEKSAQNLIKSVQSKKIINLPRFIYALGIPNVGEKTSFDLAKHFSSIEKLKTASFQDLERIRDIGPVVAKSIYDWFRDKRNLLFLEKLKKAGVEVIAPSITDKINLKLKDKIFVLTGALSTITRQAAKEKIQSYGGQVSESVSKNTSYIVVGSNPGSKLEKAKKLGIKIIDEKEFLNLFKSVS